MTNSKDPNEDRRLRRKTAAFRLKHDVGKALRWSAPEDREKNLDALRARLARDLVPRSNAGGAGRNVLESFFEWKREEGPLFAAGDPDLEAIERAMTEVGRLAPCLTAGLSPSFKESPSSSSSFSSSSSSFKGSSSSSPSRSESSPSESNSFPLSESSLLSLDDACLEASRACTAFYRRVALDDGPETVRPLGARR